jgi:hypothetical protein
MNPLGELVSRESQLSLWQFNNKKLKTFQLKKSLILALKQYDFFNVSFPLGFC